MFTVYAHRGLSSKAPENTLAAFDAAANVTGLKWIELDVAITKMNSSSLFMTIFRSNNRYDR